MWEDKTAPQQEGQGAGTGHWRGVRDAQSRRGGYPTIRENHEDKNQELSLNNCTIEHWGEGERE